MISSFGHAPLLNRTNSGEDNVSDLAEFRRSGRIILRNQIPNTPRRRCTPVSIDNKQQEQPQLQHSTTKNNQVEKKRGQKSIFVLKNDDVSGLYSNNGGRRSPFQRSPNPSAGSSRVISTPKIGSSKNVIQSHDLPEPPFRSPRSVTDVVRIEDVSVNMTGARWMNDYSLCITPVFHKRLSRPVVIIQSHVRRLLASNTYQAKRRNMSAIQIQRMARGMTKRKSCLHLQAGFKAAQLIQRVVRGGLLRVALRTTHAVTHIQRVARGFVHRLKVKVLRLENVLAAARSEHAKELEIIQKNKERDISKDIASQVNNIRQEKQKQAQLAADTITELRKNNRHLREQNAQLEVQCEELAERNERSTKVANQCAQHIEDLNTAVKKLEADQKKLMMLNGHYEKKLADVLQMIERYDELIEYERKVSSIYVNTIKDHIKQINKVCTDKNLANSIRNETISNIEKLRTQVQASA